MAPSTTAPRPERPRLGGMKSRLGAIAAGLILFAIVIVLPPPPGLETAAWRVTAVAALMAVWWILEAVPVAVTALMPICLFPLLGIAPIRNTTSPYANPLIFLFMGGFMIALAVERWNLHRRIALNVLRLFGARPARLIGGFMCATAGLSMWVSNTATTVMMLPVALSVIGLLHDHKSGANIGTRTEDRDDRNFAVALLLATAYAASIGGLATLVGTPPNALLAGYMEEVHGRSIGFGQWMLVGLPLTVLLLPIAWLLLTRFVYPVASQEIEGATEIIDEEVKKLGPISFQEIAVALIFAATACLWIGRPLVNKVLPGAGLSDAGIAIMGAVALFIVPARTGDGEFLMNWDWARRLPWGVLILFGGGLSLASAVDKTGLAAWIGGALSGIEGWPVLAILLSIVAVVIFLTEITSNTATAAVFLPVMGAAAMTFGADPLFFAAPTAVAASCAFMMPVATPPNAIIFSSGHVSVPQMARAGLPLNIVAIVVVMGAAYSLISWVFGV